MLLWCADGLGEISFRGYWYVMVSRPLPPAGSGLTTMWPSPAEDDDGGKGEFMLGGFECVGRVEGEGDEGRRLQGAERVTLLMMYEYSI